MVPGLARRGWESELDESFYQSLETLVSWRAAQDAIGLLEMRAYMGQTHLRDADMMGMAHGLEIRIPFLDCDFSSSALMLGAPSRTPRSRPKWRFVEAMGDKLPNDIINRTKQGFTLPLKEWMQIQLKETIVADLQALARFNGAKQESVIRSLWEQFCARPDTIGWYRPWILFVLGHYLVRHRLELQEVF